MVLLHTARKARKTENSPGALSRGVPGSSQGCFLMSVNVQGYGMAWGALVGDLQKNHHPGTSLSILNLIVGLFNFVRTCIPGPRPLWRTTLRHPFAHRMINRD